MSLQMALEGPQDQRPRVEDAAGIGERNGFVGLEFERPRTAPAMAASSRAASSNIRMAETSPSCAARVTSWDMAAMRPRSCAVMTLAHRSRSVLRSSDALNVAWSGPLQLAAVTHARKDVEALHRDPVGRAFIAEDLAPAPGARGLAAALAITDRAGSGDDVDSVLAAERAGPGADHVVAAAIAAMPEQRLRHGIEQRLRRAVFAVGGKTEKSVRDGAAVDSRPGGTARQARRPARYASRRCRSRDDMRLGPSHEAMRLPSRSTSTNCVFVPPPSTPRNRVLLIVSGPCVT